MICTQPELNPGSAMFTSLKLSSPFSCSQSFPETGSKAMPKLLRRPYANSFCTFAPTSPPIAAPAAKNGLSLGVEPSSLSRRIDPVRCASSGSGPPNWSSSIPGPNGPSTRFWSCPRRPLSPMTM
jgi:hypothetical protein